MEFLLEARQPARATATSLVLVALLVLLGFGFAYVSGLEPGPAREELLYKVAASSCRS